MLIMQELAIAAVKFAHLNRLMCVICGVCIMKIAYAFKNCPLWAWFKNFIMRFESFDRDCRKEFKDDNLQNVTISGYHEIIN